MVTDSRVYLSHPAAEARHLALWTGRLAYADPAWTPARKPSHAVRDPASLAPGPAELAEIASAMHYTADTWPGRPAPILIPSPPPAEPGARTSPPAACPRTTTYHGAMPMRPATGSPTPSPSTPTPPRPLRRCCVRPVTSQPLTHLVWCSAPPSRRRPTRRQHREAALSRTSSIWASAMVRCCVKAPNWTRWRGEYWPLDRHDHSSS